MKSFSQNDVNNNNNFTYSQSMYGPLAQAAINLEAEGNGNIRNAGGFSSGFTSGVFTAGSKINERLETPEIDKKDNKDNKDTARGPATNSVNPNLKLLEINDLLNRRLEKRFSLNIPFVIMSGIVFIALLAWFEALRSFYDRTWELDPTPARFNPSWERVGYALFISLISAILIWIIYNIYQLWYPNYEVVFE
jgi:hypothetical protein